MTDSAPCSGVILAGGLSKRYAGRNKAFVTVGGKRIIDRLIEVYTGLFDDILIVTNTPTDYLDLDLTIASDIYAARSSLTGIHAGLVYAGHPHAFVSACDTPFLHRRVVAGLLSAVEPHLDVVVPETDAGFEPLCAVYSKRCLKAIETQLNRNRFRIQSIFDQVRVKRLPRQSVVRLDPDGRAFININSPEDRQRAERLLSEDAPVEPMP